MQPEERAALVMLLAIELLPSIKEGKSSLEAANTVLFKLDALGYVLTKSERPPPVS